MVVILLLASSFLVISWYLITFVVVSKYYGSWVRSTWKYRIAIHDRIVSLAQACSRAKIFLHPYQNMHTAEYQKLYYIAKKHWRIARQENRYAIKKLRSWEIKSYDPAQYENRDLIPLVVNLIGKLVLLIWNDLFIRTRGLSNINEVKESIVELRSLPKRNLKVCYRLKDVIVPLIIDEISKQKLSGILMTDIKTQVVEADSRVSEITKVIEKHRNISLRSLDHVTQYLENISNQLVRIESKISYIDSKRIETGKQLNKTENNLKRYSDLLPQRDNERLILDPLFVRASSLKSDAMISYAYRRFRNANDQLKLSYELSELGCLLNKLQPTVLHIKEIKSKNRALSLSHPKIDDVIHKFEEIKSISLNLKQVQRTKTLKQEVKNLDKRARKLFKKHAKTTLKLRQKNNKLWGKLDSEHERIQKIAPLNSDPLIIAYEELAANRTQIKRNQNKLSSANETIIQLTKNFQLSNRELTPIHKGLIRDIETMRKYSQLAKDWAHEWMCLEFSTNQLDNKTLAARNLFDECNQSQSISLLRNHQVNLRKKITIAFQIYDKLCADREQLLESHKRAVNALLNADQKVHRVNEIVKNWPCLVGLSDKFQKRVSGYHDILDGIKKVSVYGTVMLRLNTLSDLAMINTEFNDLVEHEKGLDQSLSIMRETLNEVEILTDRAIAMSEKWSCLKSPANLLKSRIEKISAKKQDAQNIKSFELAKTTWIHLLKQADFLREGKIELSDMIEWLIKIETNINDYTYNITRWVYNAQKIGSTWKCLNKEAKEIGRLEKEIKKVKLGLTTKTIQEIEKTIEEFDSVYSNMKEKHLTLKKNDVKLANLELHAQGHVNELRRKASEAEKLAKQWRFYEVPAQTLSKYHEDAKQILKQAKKQKTLNLARTSFENISSLAMRVQDYQNLAKDIEFLEDAKKVTEMYLDGIEHEEWGSQAGQMGSKIKMARTQIGNAKGSPSFRKAKFQLENALSSARILFNEIPPEQIQQNQYLYDIKIEANEIYGLLFGSDSQINQNF